MRSTHLELRARIVPALLPVLTFQSAMVFMVVARANSLTMADFSVKYAIFRALSQPRAHEYAQRRGRVVVRMAELLMKSAIVESGA